MAGSRIQTWVRVIRKRVSIGWKFCLSFRKTAWGLNDYPVGLWEQEFKPEFAAPRLKQCRCRAYIENGALIGEGETPQAAMLDLAVRFEETRAERNRKGRPMPRPGIREPIEFAGQDRVNQHTDLADDFVRRVLNLEWAWISDDSSLWDFHTDQTNELLLARIKEVFGIDVSDIESAKLCEIFDRLEDAKSHRQINSSARNALSSAFSAHATNRECAE